MCSGHAPTHLVATLESVLPALISVESSCSFCRMVRRRLSEDEPKIMVVELAPCVCGCVGVCVCVCGGGIKKSYKRHMEEDQRVHGEQVKGHQSEKDLL